MNKTMLHAIAFVSAMLILTTSTNCMSLLEESRITTHTYCADCQQLTDDIKEFCELTTALSKYPETMLYSDDFLSKLRTALTQQIGYGRHGQYYISIGDLIIQSTAIDVQIQAFITTLYKHKNLVVQVSTNDHLLSDCINLLFYLVARRPNLLNIVHCKQLLDLGADINFVYNVDDHAAYSGFTPLMYAVTHPKLDENVISYLAQKGANLHAQTVTQRTIQKIIEQVHGEQKAAFFAQLLHLP